MADKTDDTKESGDPDVKRPELAFPSSSPAPFSVRGIFFVLIIVALYLARDFFVPITLAFILALTLSPVVRFFKRGGVPPFVTSFVLVLLLVGAFLAAAYAVFIPAAEMIDNAPEIGRELREKFRFVEAPMEAMKDAEQQVNEVTSGGSAGAQKVTVEGPGMLSTAAGSIVTGATSLVIMMVLLTFLLASGDLFYAKLVGVFDTLKDKKRVLAVAHDIERVISRYLFSITVINIGLGVAIGTGLYFLGMPNALTWGVFAALANFIPYIGAVLGLLAVGTIALVTFDTISPVIAISGFYLTCTFIEGQFLTPLIIGRRLELNAVAVFISVAFWAWLWGIVGALIAVPVLVLFKTILDQLQGWQAISQFLAARTSPQNGKD